MIIRLASIEEAALIKQIYENAKLFMRKSGNLHQWGGDYPELSLIEKDIKSKNCYVCLQDGEILGVFCLFDAPDKTYLKIYEGSWQSDSDYNVIHRIAVKTQGLGIAKECFDFAYSIKKHLRIDTHRDNIPMQKALIKNGFVRCGIIYLESGDERIAFEKFDENS